MSEHTRVAFEAWAVEALEATASQLIEQRSFTGGYWNPRFDAAHKAYQHRQPEIDALTARAAELEAENKRLDCLINNPHTMHFLESVQLEAAHQQERWASSHDAGKADPDWFWLLGFLAGKAIRPDQTPEKRLHHIITSAAACLNWHAHVVGYRDGPSMAVRQPTMRPGIAEEKQI